MESKKIPLPGFGLVIIDTTQMDNVEFKGDDRFDTPQSGKLIKLTKQDAKKQFDDEGHTYGDLINKRIYWAKYADADATLYDNDLNTDVVFIQLDKLRGYEK
jgi:hypothetical protein